MDGTSGFPRDFDAWFRTLDDGDQEAIVIAVEQVKRHGIDLDSSPLVDDIGPSRRPNQRELRVKGGQLRVRFTFDRTGPLTRLHSGSGSR